MSNKKVRITPRDFVRISYTNKQVNILTYVSELTRKARGCGE